VPRTIADIARDLTALAGEVSARTGKVLLVQNLIASSALNRISNYAWLGESFSENPTVMAMEANLMLSDVARAPNVSMIDSDALAADLGVRHVPDGAHASRALVEAQRCEYQRVLRARGIAGF
jgi:pyruvate/2-oxoacid:ferredoxin oxidoreductase beta subunit